MRILLISECYPSAESPQYCVFIKQQFDQMRVLGHEVSVVIPKRSRVNTPIVLEHDSIGDHYCFSYKADRYELRIGTYGREIADLLEQVPELQNNDLISVQITSDFVLYGMLIFGRKHKIPVVQHYHGLNVFKEYQTKHPLRSYFYASRRKCLLMKTAGVIGVSEKVTNIVRKSCPRLPVHTVYNGVDTDRFLCCRSFHTDFRVLGVGNLIPIKGFQYLLEGFSMAVNRGFEATLHIVGNGPEKAALEKQAMSCRIIDRVVFHGTLPYEKVAEQMNQSDIFVLPSFYEALGCVYLEAMACGLPTVGVKGMGIDEIILDGENGFLVQQKNSEKIADLLCLLFSDAGLRTKIGQQARETAQRYTWRASAVQLEQRYKELLNLK